MSIDSEGPSIESQAADILKPIDDLHAKEAEELNKADERIGAAERKSKELVSPAKRIDEE